MFYVRERAKSWGVYAQVQIGSTHFPPVSSFEAEQKAHFQIGIPTKMFSVQRREKWGWAVRRGKGVIHAIRLSNLHLYKHFLQSMLNLKLPEGGGMARYPLDTPLLNRLRYSRKEVCKYVKITDVYSIQSSLIWNETSCYVIVVLLY
jgi:hypothetical protein